jgi:hypothetical protein
MSSFTTTTNTEIHLEDENPTPQHFHGEFRLNDLLLPSEYSAEDLQIPPLERCATVETPFTEDPESGEIRDLDGNVVAVLEPNVSQDDRMKVYAELLQKYITQKNNE